MTTLFNKFVTHYTNVSQSIKTRRIYEKSWKNVNRDNEVNAIRSFLLDKSVGVHYLNTEVSPKLSNSDFQVKFASIFCHQKPRVQRTVASNAIARGDTSGCELGDLFVIFVLLDNTDRLHYAAGALFQAKLKPKLDSLSQKYLYDIDEDFEVPSYLENRTNPPEKLRKMPTYMEGRARALRYLILNPRYTGKYVQARHTPWQNDHQRQWSTFLDGLLSGTDGLRTNLSSANPSSWDIMVADLLMVGLNVPHKKTPRGNDVAVQVATALFNNFRDLTAYSVDTKESDGVPIFMAIVCSTENH